MSASQNPPTPNSSTQIPSPFPYNKDLLKYQQLALTSGEKRIATGGFAAWAYAPAEERV